jgi:transposase
VPELIEDARNELPGRFRLCADRLLLQHLKELDRHVRELEREIEVWHRGNEVSFAWKRTQASALHRKARWWPRPGPEQLQERAAVRWHGIGLVPHSEIQRMQGAAAGHQQARRRLPSDAADHGGRALVQLGKTRVDRAGTWLGQVGLAVDITTLLPWRWPTRTGG